jgi:putative cell wall-binding protein
VTKTELARLKPATIYVLGGTGAVSSTVASQLASYARSSVVRLAGANRYATAGAIVANAFPSANEVIVATGANFPDALAAGAAGASAGIPILLVTGTSVPSSTAAQLARLSPDKIWIVGGTGVVSTGVETALHAWAPTERLAGPNRYATAVATSEAFFDSTNGDHIFVATGLNFPDALGAGVFGDPVLLTMPGSLPPDPAWEVVRLQPSSVHVLGGPAVISNTVVDQLKARC